MPPTPKYTRDEIINAAYNLVRDNGLTALTARDLAKKLGTSPRPIFTAFKNMDDLKNEVIKKAFNTFEAYQKNEIESRNYPTYKATGMAYIRLAKEEKNIFKLLYMRDRTGEGKNDFEDYSLAINALKNHANITDDEALLVHLKMWIYVHGIATMLATSYLDFNFDEISNLITDMYNRLISNISGGK